MQKRKLLILALLILVSARTLQAQPYTKSAVRDTLNLDGKWNVVVDWYDNANQNIIRDKKPSGKNEFLEFSFDNSMSLQVPGDWNSQKPELKYYEGIVWYKRNFNYSPKDNKLVFLQFGAVSYQCDVFLNGEKLGSHEGGFTSFQFDATAKLKNGENLLIVKVNNQRKENNIPALKFDWWNYGGITRSVKLVQIPSASISDYFIQLKKGSLNQVAGWVKLNTKRKEDVFLEIPEAGIRKALRADSNGYISILFTAKLSPWSPEHPRLYKVLLRTKEDLIQDEIGFRSIEVKDGEILLNKKPVFLRGISFHEEIAACAGRAYSESDAKSLLGSAKELGCNFVRLAHYPQSEQTVRMAEKMGLMMWEEIPVWQGIQFGNPEIRQKAGKMLEEMIERDKNRCGIIIWSISNETSPGKERNETLAAMALEARILDPTRLISSAFDHFKQNKNEILIDDPLSEHLDVLAANKYMGWYHPWPAEPGNVIWKSNFKKPLIISEFGSEALYGNHGSKDTASLWTEEHQEQLYRDNINMFKGIPFLRGVCPWILADFRSPFRMQAEYQEGWNRKGLLSDKGFKKKAWYVMYNYYKELSKE
ncbi:glycoside hydrolase family 2 protein [Desertivirga arenae]|uniref:glycoside hydrolase family 2 protein n=1 Tax=Desertivirga arenae TaxID=2810309 RepID=UPI001A9717E5|nr:glycoside hydrolase family 2 TIM barrel-domain containing protein [Pedobacter sp. SYSU D00823]